MQSYQFRKRQKNIWKVCLTMWILLLMQIRRRWQRDVTKLPRDWWLLIASINMINNKNVCLAKSSSIIFITALLPPILLMGDTLSATFPDILKLVNLKTPSEWFCQRHHRQKIIFRQSSKSEWVKAVHNPIVE